MSYLKSLKYAVLLPAFIMIGFGSIVTPVAADPLADALDSPVQTDGVTPLSFITGTTGGSGGEIWSAVDTTVYTGVTGSAAQSGVIGNSQSTWIQTSVAGPASLAFYQKVSSQAGYDFLKFSIDNVVKNSISGAVNWQQKMFTLPTGTHTLQWTYAKNASGASGSDAAWLDRVVVSPNTALAITYPNGGENLISGSTVTIAWNAPAAAEQYDLYYTTNNGTSWTRFETNWTSSDFPVVEYSWTVPLPPGGNKTKCKVKVVAKNKAGAKVGADISNAPFVIQVLNVTAPNGDIVSARTGTYTIGFDVSGVNDPAASAIISYTVNGGLSWPVIGIISGGSGITPGLYTWPWPVPAVSAVKNAKVKVVIKSGSKVLAAATSANFTILPVFTISGVATLGGAALANVNMTLGGYDTLGGYESGTTMTDVHGKYSFTMLLKGNYTVSAAKTGNYFNPAVTTLALTTKSATANFKATASPDTLYTLSGNVSGATTTSVTVTLTGALSGSMMTDGSGNYAFANLPVGNYNVMPAKTGYTFSPLGMGVALSTADATGIDFIASPSEGATYSISGKAVYNGAGVAGATITVGGAADATVLTDAGGNYIVKGLKNGYYTLTPSSDRAYDFSPAEAKKTVSGANITGVNFTGLGPVLGTLITSLGGKTPIASFTQNIPSNDHTGPYDEIFPGMANLWSLDMDFSLANGFDNQFMWAETLAVGGTFNGVVSGISEDFDYSGGGDIFPVDQQFGDPQYNYLCMSVADGGMGCDPPTFYTPLMRAEDGLEVATVSTGTLIGGSLPAGLVSGSQEAFLNATSDSRLQQILDLTSLPTGSSISISWNDALSLDPGTMEIGYNLSDPTIFPFYQVVLRKLDGTLLKTLYHADLSGTTPPYTMQNHPGYRNIAYVGGQKVVLSFEMKSSNNFLGTTLGSDTYASQAYAIINTVSAVDSTLQEHVTNGDFASGDLTGWTTNTAANKPAEVQNITSGARTILVGTGADKLTVKRSFYTVPNKLWGRWVDVFSNPTGHAITTIVAYETELGSNKAGIIYDPVSYGTSTVTAPDAHALTVWDSTYYLCFNALGSNCDGTRDVGLVFGNANSVNFLSADGFFNDGSDFIDLVYDVTVPAGGRVAIVNFVIMDGTDTGFLAIGGAGAAAQATEIDDEAKKILNNFWTDPQYRDGMTSQQIGAIVNFPKN